MNAMKKFLVISTATFSLSFLLSLDAQAIQIDMAPGLWEHTFKMSGDGVDAAQKQQMDQMKEAMAKMKEQMANMTPEQRQMMEQVMQKNNIKMSDGGVDTQYSKMQFGKDGTKIKVCMTKEDIDRGEMHTQKDECTEKMTQLDSKTFKVVYECKGQVQSKGETEIKFNDSKSYQGKSTMVTTMNGKSQTINTEQSGKWLSSDCGDIKPYKPKDTAK